MIIHPYYGRMAYNLAVSLKANDSGVKIALGYAGDALRHLSDTNIKQGFDVVIELPENVYRVDGIDKWIRAKTFMYDISPWSETLFLDADTIWLPRHRVSDVMKELRENEFAIANHESFDVANLPENLNIWAKVADTAKAFNLTGQYYSVHSEFVFFKRSEELKAFF